MKDQILFWVDRLLEFKEELKQMAPLLKDAIPSIFISPMYDLYECQILYTIIRVLKPMKIVDVGCGCGWTTFWILSAANKNDNGATVFTYDIAPSCVDLTKQNIARFNFSKVQWQTVLGNFMATAKQILPEPIDLLFLDADHT